MIFLTVQFWMEWLVQVVIAIATIAAVIVALFGGWLRSRLASPRLHLSLVSRRGVQVPSVLSHADGTKEETKSRWYHLKLENQRRWAPANQCHVYLVTYEERDAAGTYQLAWRGAVPMKVRNVGVVLEGFAVGPQVEFDLCSVIKPGIFQLHPVLAPNSVVTYSQAPVAMRLTFQARSVEKDGELLRVEIRWDGLWDDDGDDMERHLVLNVS